LHLSEPHVLFLSYPLVGHLNPQIAVMQRLGAAGCRVTCLLPGADAIDAARREALSGIDLRFYAGGAPSIGMAPRSDETNGADWVRRFMATGPARVPAARAAIRTCAPDFIVADPFPLNGAALAAAHAEEIPYALLWPNLLAVTPLRVRGGFRSEVDEALRATLAPFGVAWSEEFASPRSPLLNMTPVIPEFIGGEVSGVELVGLPQAPERRGDEVDFDWSRVPAEPFVYLAFGTIFQRRDILDVFFSAARRLGVRMLASVGALVDQLDDYGDDIVLASYVPQREVLRRASVFVTHGGYNSVAEALRAGISMLVLPLGLDQPLQAHYVTESGVGLALDPASLTEQSAFEALRALCKDASGWRARAASLAQVAARTDTTARTVGRLLTAIETSR
jgi:UDP:flavonoid glycosyltransferase YjiC (YdhE family)